MRSCFLTSFVLMVAAASCSLFESAADAALRVFKEKSPELISSAADAAKTYWGEHKDEVAILVKDTGEAALSSAKTYAEEKLAEARTYVDTKMSAARDKTVQKLLAKGVPLAELDTDGDGAVSDDELAAYQQKNPMSLLWTGGTGLAFYGLWLARQKLLDGVRVPS